jgi:hypothetical protein
VSNFIRFLSAGSHPPFIRKNIGWKIEEHAVRRIIRITHANGSVEDIDCQDRNVKEIAKERGWHRSWNRAKGEVKTDGPYEGMKFEIILE